MSCSKLGRLVRASGRCSGVAPGTSHLAYTAGLLRETLRREAEVLTGRPDDRRQGAVDLYSLPSLDPLPHIAPGRLLDCLKKACAGCGAAPQRPGLWYTIGDKVYCEDCAPEAALSVSASLLIPKQETEDDQGRRQKQRWAEDQYRQNAALLSVTPTSLVGASDNRRMTPSSATGKLVSGIDARVVPRIATPQAPPPEPDGEPVDNSAVFIDRLKEPGHFVSGPAASPTYSDTDGRPMAVFKAMTLKKSDGAKVFESGGKRMRGQLDEIYLLEDERGNSSGWAITPVLQEIGGMVIPTHRFTITHRKSGVDVTTQSFESPEAAFALGERLAQIDVDLASDRELRRIAATIRATLQAYQNEQLRREVSGSEEGLTHQIGLDPEGEAVRVLEDLGEILVVTNQTGQTRNLPRRQFRATEVFDAED